MGERRAVYSRYTLLRIDLRCLVNMRDRAVRFSYGRRAHLRNGDM